MKQTDNPGADTTMLQKYADQVVNCLRCSHLDALLAIYALLKAKEAGKPMQRSSAIGVAWDALSALGEQISAETLRQLILSPELFEIPYATPSAINTLALRLLNLKSGDSVADFGAGGGGFLMEALSSTSDAAFFGMEINPDLAAIASVRAELLGGTVEIAQADMFTLWDGQRKFSKIFSNFPFGMRELHQTLSQREEVQFPKSGSSDWLFSQLITRCLAENGKAVCVMTRGALFNNADITARRFFIENGLIEAVIALPEKLFSDTLVSTALVVFSAGNMAVRFVDASELYDKGRRQNELQESHINAILDALDNDSKISCTVPLLELASESFSLDPIKRLTKPIEVSDGVVLGTIASITRGAQVTAKDLDEITSIEPTDCQFLRLCDIEDGIINDDLPYLKGIAPRLQKYCVKPGNLLLSRNGPAFKMAVAGDFYGKTVLATGNLFILELDESIQPLYLQAFLESNVGTQTLYNTLSGTTVPVIKLEALIEIQVPCPPLAEQKQVVERYQASQDTLRSLKQQLANAIEASKTIFEEVKEQIIP